MPNQKMFIKYKPFAYIKKKRTIINPQLLRTKTFQSRASLKEELGELQFYLER